MYSSPQKEVWHASQSSERSAWLLAPPILVKLDPVDNGPALKRALPPKKATPMMAAAVMIAAAIPIDVKQPKGL
jgi:hypothetical protein